MPRAIWKPNAETEHWEAPPGIAPWRELSDDEFQTIVAGTGYERFFERHSDDSKKGRAAVAADGEER